MYGTVNEPAPVVLGGYAFSAPRPLAAWRPEPIEGIYAILTRTTGRFGTDRFEPLYIAPTAEWQEHGFPTTHPRRRCWLYRAGTDDNLFYAVHDTRALPPEQRTELEHLMAMRLAPPCNL